MSNNLAGVGAQGCPHRPKKRYPIHPKDGFEPLAILPSHRWRPLVCFGLGVLVPRIQRVVHDQAVFQYPMVIGKVIRQTQRNGIKPCRLQCKLETGGVGAQHNSGKLA